MKSLSESILSSNNAQGLVKQIVNIFKQPDTPSNKYKLKELWTQTGLEKSDCTWVRSVSSVGYNYEYETDGRLYIMIAIREKKYMYIRNSMPELEKEKLIGFFGLNPINLKNTSDIFETYQF